LLSCRVTGSGWGLVLWWRREKRWGIVVVVGGVRVGKRWCSCCNAGSAASGWNTAVLRSVNELFKTTSKDSRLEAEECIYLQADSRRTVSFKVATRSQ